VWKDYEDRIIHLPDVTESTMRLFQWWLYAQPSRFDAVDTPVIGKIHGQDAVNILRLRNPKYITENHAKSATFSKNMREELQNASYSRLLTYGREMIPPI
jgi:hypothetical protein